LILLVLLTAFSEAVSAQTRPSALVVIAHPADESMLSVTLYKLAKEHHGNVELFVITNGEAGYPLLGTGRTVLWLQTDITGPAKNFYSPG